MKKPEKFKYIVSTPNKKEDRFKFHEDCGYNRAIDDYETWLKEAMSAEKIEKTIKKYFRISTQWDSEELAKAIHKLIGK